MKSKKSVLKEKFGVELKEVKEVTLFIRAVDNCLRWKMLEALAERGELTVTELIKILKKEQSAISSYLAVLRKQGLVEYRREHKNVYYKVNESNMEFLKHIVSLIKSYHEIDGFDLLFFTQLK
jgi:DNA-binding transcriptional ArsR family regulator